MFKSFPPPLGGTVGDKTAMFQLSLRYVPPRSILCRYQPPFPCREILFLHRFEQEEEEEVVVVAVVGRWSRRKRQACGPRETSCSLLFCDKTRLEGTTVHRAAAAAAASAFKPTTHHRRRINPVFQLCARSPGRPTTGMRTTIIVGIVPDLTF